MDISTLDNLLLLEVSCDMYEDAIFEDLSYIDAVAGLDIQDE